MIGNKKVAFYGIVFQALKAEDFDSEDIEFAQKSLRILSGLYGILRPTDFIQPYPLEMGQKLENQKGSNLYSFWQDISIPPFAKI
ncbi:peroxide stress protein YaaA [Clostridium thermarum]|uniref:peroxide stress protein YaaA n=1 Tax=Clostridium thermarum TaxID=1716543 RepID=UPI001A9AE201|nr:peroxide stress protein YaaA [Clostridium thermarum]